MANENLNLEQQFPNNPSLMSEIDAATIAQTTPAGYVPDPYSQQVVDAYNAQFTPKETGMLGPNALYPGAGHNINVGTYGGSRIGSNPIFVPGGNIMAVDPVLERRKALDDAARLKASSIKPFTYQTPKVLDARFQKDLTNKAESFAKQTWDETVSVYGKDAGIVLSDQNTPEGRRFLQGMANFETMGKNFDQIYNFMAEMDKGLQDKTTSYSPEMISLYKDFKNLTGEFANGNVESGSNLAAMYDKLHGVRSVEDYIQSDNFLKDFQPTVSQIMRVGENGDYFSVKTGKKISYDQGINEAVDNMVNNGDWDWHVESGVYESRDKLKEAFRKGIKARLKNSYEESGSIQQKSEATRGAEQIEEIPDPNTSINFYKKDELGSADIYDYDKFGNRKGRISLGALAEAPMRIVGSEKSIYERTPNGDLKQTKFKGVPLSNIQIVTGEGKSTDIPGNVYAELGELMQLKDGTMVQKARYTRPTQVKSTPDIDNGERGDSYKEGGKTKYRSYKTTDAFTFEDGYIILEQNGKPTGTRTEIKQNIQSKEARERYEKSYMNVRDYTGDVKNAGTSGKSKYTSEQESVISKNIKANPDYSREEIIQALGY